MTKRVLMGKRNFSKQIHFDPKIGFPQKKIQLQNVYLSLWLRRTLMEYLFLVSFVPNRRNSTTAYDGR